MEWMNVWVYECVKVGGYGSQSPDPTLPPVPPSVPAAGVPWDGG